MIITIADFPIDSLANWKDPFDIKKIHPYLTMQECRLASNFHALNRVEFKAKALVEIVKSMTKDGDITEPQILFITELVNWDSSIMDSLINKFNNQAKLENIGVKLEVVDYE